MADDIVGGSRNTTAIYCQPFSDSLISDRMIKAAQARLIRR